MPKLTFGIAHHEDFHGAYFTLQNIRLLMQEYRFTDYELVVVDNSPTSKHSQDLRDLLAKMSENTEITYYAMNEKNGTTQTRNQIFVQAKGEWVVVMDCHVLLPLMAITRFIRIANGDMKLPPKSIFSGPMIHDTMSIADTHFNDEWRSDMWGTWGSTWLDTVTGKLFSPYDLDGNLAARTIEMQPINISKDIGIEPGTPSSGFTHNHSPRYQPITNFTFAALQKQYPKILSQEYMPIPGMGLGMFFCRRADWVGFNPHCRGFGGEELCIHEKFRKSGGDAYCVFTIPWLHRFYRPDGISYHPQRYDTVRNYILWFNDLNRPLTEVHDHFVNSGTITQQLWEHIVADPINRENPDAGKPVTKPGCQTCGKLSETPVELSLSQAFDFVVNTPRDLNEHALALRSLAESCPRITEFTKRRESSVIWANAKPDTLWTYYEQEEPLLTKNQWLELSDKAGRNWHNTHQESSNLTQIEETDLLWIDTHHTHARLMHELNLAVGKVKKYIVIRGTAGNAEEGEDKGPGLLQAIRDFLAANPDWQMKQHWPHQYGVTVLSCLQEDKPALPSVFEMAWNYSTTMAAHAANGFKVVDEETASKRLAICEVCPAFLNKERRCSMCGCPVESKATLEVSTCPISKW